MEPLKKLFPTGDDPYEAVDWGTALRLGAVLWVFGAVVGIGLWTLSPPDEAIGGTGWAISVMFAATAFLLAAAYRSSRIEWTPETLLLTNYFAVLALATMQWLSGGVGAPYTSLLLLPVVYVAVLHPPGRVAAYMGVVALTLMAPFVYDGWDSDEAAATIASFILWSVLACAALIMMSGVRAQRLALRRGEIEARELARLDDLTGIGNRRAFEEELAIEIERSRRSGEPLAVAMADVDSFKSVNDEFGHLEGDRCLREVADAIGSELRIPDRCFRWGGDEFALLLPGTGVVAGEQLAERLRNFVAVRCPRPDGEPMQLRFGVAELNGAPDAEELVARADLALTEARPGRR